MDNKWSIIHTFVRAGFRSQLSDEKDLDCITHISLRTQVITSDRNQSISPVPLPFSSTMQLKQSCLIHKENRDAKDLPEFSVTEVECQSTRYSPLLYNRAGLKVQRNLLYG